MEEYSSCGYVSAASFCHHYVSFFQLSQLIAVVITDGASTDDVSTPARQLHEAGGRCLFYLYYERFINVAEQLCHNHIHQGRIFSDAILSFQMLNMIADLS